MIRLKNNYAITSNSGSFALVTFVKSKDKEGNEISLIDILESIDEDVSEKLWIEDNLKVLKKNIYEVLTPRERKIIFMRYGIPDGKKEYTQREVAAKLGISRSYVSRIEKRALDKLKRKYEYCNCRRTDHITGCYD